MQKQLIYINIGSKARVDEYGAPITDPDSFIEIERGQWQVLCIQFVNQSRLYNPETGESEFDPADLSGGSGFLFVADNDFNDSDSLMLKSYQSTTPFNESDPTSNRINIPGDWLFGGTADLSKGQMSIRINADTEKFAQVTGERASVASGLYANIKQFMPGLANPSNIAWFQFRALNTIRDWNETEEIPPSGELHIPIIQSYLSSPFEYQFSPDATSWHSVQLSGDLYYRQRLQNVDATWSAAIKMIQGAPGADGNDGQDGTSAGFGSITATVQTLASSANATVNVNTSGTKAQKNIAFSFGIPKGKDGPPGADGKTPVRGVDYFTAEDVNVLLEELKVRMAKALITDTTSTAVTLASLQTNALYRYTQPLTSIDISNVTDTTLETDIEFTAAEGFQLLLPANVKVETGLSFNAGGSYLINFYANHVVAGEFVAGDDV